MLEKDGGGVQTQMTPGLFIVKEQRRRRKLSNLVVDETADWSVTIPDEDIKNLTSDQIAALQELDDQQMVLIPLRQGGGTQRDMLRAKIYKTLAYKDLCGFSVSINSDPPHWTFFQKGSTPRM